MTVCELSFRHPEPRFGVLFFARALPRSSTATIFRPYDAPTRGILRRNREIRVSEQNTNTEKSRHNGNDRPIPPLRPVETLPFEEDGREFILLRDPLGFSEKMIAVAREATPLLGLMNGQLTGDELIHQFRELTGADVDSEQLDALVDMLEDAKLLQSETFLAHRERLETEFRERKTRDATLAGGGYPDDPDELKRYLDVLLDTPVDEDVEPEIPAPGKRLRGLMLPHIDFHRGGETYGRGYRAARAFIDELPDPLLVGVIGVSHYGGNFPIVATSKDFLTPLGALQSDKKALEILRDELGDAPFVEEWAHKNEHSVELQVVWLQHLLEGRNATLLPLTAGILAPGPDGTPASDPRVAKSLSALRRIENEHEGGVLWVASVDLAHMGPNFGEERPVDARMRADVAKYDQQALDAVRSGDAEAWWSSLMADDNARRICGLNTTYLWLKLLEGTQGVLIDYQQAISDDNQLMVSFAAGLQQA